MLKPGSLRISDFSTIMLPFYEKVSEIAEDARKFCFLNSLYFFHHLSTRGSYTNISGLKNTFRLCNQNNFAPNLASM